MENSLTNERRSADDRIALSDQLAARFVEGVFRQPVPKLAKRTGLPYLLVYNIVHRRVKSISLRHYRILFGEEPGLEAALKVDGAFFRKMVDLWIYLLGGQAKSELYRTLFDSTSGRRIDYRIFTGRVRSVDPDLERRMLKRFETVGLDRSTVERWVDEARSGHNGGRVPYERVRPDLLLIREVLGVHPSVVLRQVFERYERGNLRTVSQRTGARILALRQEALRARDDRRGLSAARLRERIYGPKSGYTLFAEVVEELRLLMRYGGMGAKRYLGRGLRPYESGEIRHIASWRARRIVEDCTELIGQRTDLPLDNLPGPYRTRQILPLLVLLLARAADLLSRAEGRLLEKRLLRPSRASEEYKRSIHGFTQFDRAARSLGMKQRAFDLMVAENCDIFRGVGRYDRRWYLSDLYLKELSKNRHFGLISIKYERMARMLARTSLGGRCMH